MKIPEPPRAPYTKKRRWWAMTTLIVIAVLVFCGLYAWQSALRAISTPVVPGDTRVESFSIARGEGVRDVALRLQKAGVIRHAALFEFYARSKNASHRLQAGKYMVSRSMAILEILDRFVAGRVVPNEVTLTFPEGYTARDMDALLAQKGLLKTGAFLAVAAEWEGYLFPDTYRFQKDASASTVRDTPLTNFKKKFTATMRRDASLALQKLGVTEKVRKNCESFTYISKADAVFSATSSQELARCEGEAVVIMASLVEKEVRTPQDMKIVSGILWKRLEIGMPLQVDATIVYLTGKKTGQVTYDDLKVESPYNTYLRAGLPPSPIANPGLNALLAAVYPQESDYLYYLSKTTGETVFSKTLEEHNRAKAMYLP